MIAAIWGALSAAWAAVRASKAATYAAMAGGAVAALLALLWRARRQGASEARREMERDELERAYDAERTRGEIERDIAGRGAAADELRRDWTRR